MSVTFAIAVPRLPGLLPPLVEATSRRPFRQADDELGTRLADLDKLTDADRAALLHILDGLLANIRIRAALNTAG